MFSFFFFFKFLPHLLTYYNCCFNKTHLNLFFITIIIIIIILFLETNMHTHKAVRTSYNL